MSDSTTTATNSERFRLARRHARYYETILKDANQLYSQGGDAAQEGLKQFDIERANIEAGFTWAAANATRDEAAAELCNSYPNAGYRFLDIRQSP